jgi:hypothetical protein
VRLALGGNWTVVWEGSVGGMVSGYAAEVSGLHAQRGSAE